MAGNVQLAILHISLLKKMNKTMENNDQKWPNLESSGRFLGKPFSAKYINLYNLVLILWKVPKIEEKFQNDENYNQRFMIFGRHIWENVLFKAYKSIYHQKDNFIRFSFFFFFLMRIFCIISFFRYCIISDSIYHSPANFWSFFASFSPDI